MTVTAERLRRHVERFADRVADEWAEALEHAVREAAPQAAATGDPRQRPPGTMRRAVRASPVQRLGSGYRFGIHVPGIEARTTEGGARPHVIRPRRSGVLMFYAGGERVFARKVLHPGNPPSYWFSRAIRQHAAPTLRAAGRSVGWQMH